MNEAALNSSVTSHPLLFIALLIPLLSFLTAILIPGKYSWIVALFCSLLMLFCAVFSIVSLATFSGDNELVVIDWFHVMNLNVTMNLLITKNSLLMLAVVMFVSFLVHMYSIGYMATDSRLRRYYGMLGFFTFSMAGIVLADNLLLIFLFWELVGFCSYMLIAHYMEKPSAARAATKAFIFNRIGDAGFLIGIMIIWTSVGTLDLSVVKAGSNEWLSVAALCIFCGIIGKSAQFPLFSWLPDAMEGPTPVSALIHAATMVAAGVYLLTRIFFLFAPEHLMIVGIVGLFTSALAALSALAQYDIKKILAYSTISQLGLMVAAIGSSAADAAFLHLITHAFFKAGLFLCAGSVINSLHLAQRQSHSHFDVQDIRNMGGLRSQLPVTFLTFTITAASLAGIPMLSGFLSKEAMLNGTLASNTFFHEAMFAGMLLVSFLTVLYSFRLIWKVFISPPQNNIPLLYESPAVMRLPMIALAVLSLWIVVAPTPLNYNGWFIENESIPVWLTFTSIGVVLLALLCGWVFLRSNEHRKVAVLVNGFYVDKLFPAVWRGVMLRAARLSENTDQKYIDGAIHFTVVANVTTAHLISWIDAKVVDGIVTMLTNVVRMFGWMVRLFQGGKIQLYIFWAILAIIIFLIWQLI